MYYTITSLKEVHSNKYLDFGKKGNKYWVSYSSRDDEDTITVRSINKEFDDLGTASERYLKIAGWMMAGCYNDDARIQYLMTGTMD